MNPIHSVGLLGLGKMGAPMAGHLIRKGFKVVGFDPTPAACAQASALGVHMVPSPAEVARQSDMVLVVVGFDSEVEDALWGPEGVVQGAAPGLIVALGSTVSPSYARTLGVQLLQKHLTLLDIPLTRGEAAAIFGKMLILGAGEPQAFEACRPVFETFASDIFHLGDTAGAGQVGKMVNNLILWACTAANDEGLRLGEVMGVDPLKMRAALHHSSAQNWAMDERADLSGMPWAEKDMNIVLQEADQARISLPLCGTIKEVIKGLKIRMGLGIPQVVVKLNSRSA